MQFLTGLVAAMKGVVALRDLADTFVSMWLLYQESAEDRIIDKHREVRAGLLAALKQPGMSNAERRAIRQHLFDLYYSGKLPKPSEKA